MKLKHREECCIQYLEGGCMLTEKTFTVDGFSMNYAEGPQAGAPLVLIHGATLWWKDFEPLFPSLIQNWHIYACDMRGHGKSSRTPGKYRAIDFSTDIVTFVQKQIQNSVVLIGHSNGGTLALLTAAQIPELVRAVILLEPVTIARNTPIQSIPGPGDWIIGVGDVLESRRSARDFILEFSPEADEVELQNTESLIRSVDPEFISVMVKNKFFDGLQLEETLTKVLCPTLLLYGDVELGSLVPEREVEFLKNHIPQITTGHIESTGHFPHSGQTETTIEHIDNFLKTI
jgi:pimeloyl-ACP methyl ester carboxylesterase